MAAVTSALSVSLALTAVAQSSVVPPAVGLARFLAHATHDVEEARIHVAVSGGSLPSILATALGSMSDAERAYCGVERWHVWLVDERMVAAHDAASNFKACMDTFMKRELGLNPDNIHPVPTHLTPQQAARAYEEEVVAHTSRSGAAADAAMHITLLGMGEDGHTASLFPGHALLEEGEALIGVELASPKPPPQRVTFTLPFIARSRAVRAARAPAPAHMHAHALCCLPACLPAL